MSLTPEHVTAASDPAPSSTSLTIAYSDWPGWVAWEIAEKKGFFRDAGLDVKLLWLDYVSSMEAFSGGKADAVCMTNGDALVLASSGARSVGILLNDYSNGNDMIVAGPDITDVAQLKGKKIGVEVGFVDHLLLLEALKTVGLHEADVVIVNERTHKTPDLLASGTVAAIAAWQPNSGQALERVPGSTAIFTSAHLPGLIYDLLFVSPASLSRRRAEWKKVIEVWFRVTEYLQDPATRPEAIRLMSERVKMSPQKYEQSLAGTFLLGRTSNSKHFLRGPGLDSVYGSSEAANRFNVENRIYKDPQDVDSLFDPSLLAELNAAK